MHKNKGHIVTKIEHTTVMNIKLKPAHYISQIFLHENMLLQHKIGQQTNPQVVAMHIKLMQIRTWN